MFDLTAEEARLLLSAALMAVGGNRFVSAAKILAVLERFRPDHASVASAKMVALMSAAKFKEAVEFADADALVRFPADPMLMAFKGMALFRMGENDAAYGPLAQAAEQEVNPAARKLASDLLDDLRGQGQGQR